MSSVVRRLRSVPIHTGNHTRGYLPHVKLSGAAFFVTFRLADSLPKEVVLRLKEERRDLQRRADLDRGGQDEAAALRLLEWYSEQVDAELDKSLGAAWMKRPEIASVVADVLRHFEHVRYLLHAWCVMPTHVHTVVRPLPGFALEQILQSWKTFSARQANRLIGKTGEAFWQRESYDHLIRDDEDFARCCNYTEQNPVKAKQCPDVSDWPWSSAHLRPKN